MANFLNAFFGAGNPAAVQRARQARNNLAAAHAIGAAAQGVGGDPLAAQRQANQLFTNEQAQADVANQQLALQQNQLNNQALLKGIGTLVDTASAVGGFFSTQGTGESTADSTDNSANPNASGLFVRTGPEGSTGFHAAPTAPTSTNLAPQAPVEGVPQMLANPNTQPVGTNSVLAPQPENNRTANVLGTVANLGTTAASLFSDNRAKDNIQPTTDAEMRDFLNSFQGREFDMKPELGGQHMVGTTAQELERTPVGQTMVQTEPNGLKSINQNSAISALLAATKNLHERINHLEGKPQGGPNEAEARRRLAEEAAVRREIEQAQAQDANRAESMRAGSSDPSRPVTDSAMLARLLAREADARNRAEANRTQSSSPDHPLTPAEEDAIRATSNNRARDILTPRNVEEANRTQSSAADRPLTPEQEASVRAGTDAANQSRREREQEATIRRLMDELRNQRNR